MSLLPPEGGVLLLEQDMERCELRAFAGGSAGFFTSRCPIKSTANEDAAALLPLGPTRGVLVVADGVGGHRAGASASRLAIEQLAKAVDQPATGEIREAILNAVEGANRDIQTLGIGAATTLAVAEVHGRSVRPYHVGDSTVMVVGAGGELKFETVPHSPVGYAVRAGLLDEEQAMHHEDRHLVFNILGSAEMSIEVGPSIVLGDGDTLLLASDGLSDNLFMKEIVEMACRETLAEVMEGLTACARERMAQAAPHRPHKPDDLTLIAYRAE